MTKTKKAGNPAKRHGVKGNGNAAAARATRYGPVQHQWYSNHLPRSWVVLSTTAAFALSVVVCYDWLMSPPHQDGVDPYPSPRVHMEPLAPRVHPEPVVIAIASNDGAGPKGTAVFDTSRPWALPMGTSIAPPLPVIHWPSDSKVVVEKEKIPPKAKQPKDDGNKPDRMPAMDAQRDARLKPTGSMSTNRRVSGNGGRLILEPRTMRMLIELERRWGERLQIRWAYRDSKLNRKVGGAGRSLHLKKQAMDIVHGGWSRDKMRRFVVLAYSIGFRGFGLGGNVIHLDTRARLTSWNYGGNRYGLAYGMLGRSVAYKGAVKGKSHATTRKHTASKKRAVAKKQVVSKKKVVVKKRVVTRKKRYKKVR